MGVMLTEHAPTVSAYRPGHADDPAPFLRLAAAASSGAVDVPRTVVLPGLARPEGPVQANGSGRRVGGVAASDGDDRLQRVFRPARRHSIRRRPVPGLQSGGPRPLGVLRLWPQ